MNRLWIVSLAAVLLLSACSGAGSQPGFKYVIVTMVVDTPVPFKQVTSPPSKTPPPSRTPSPTPSLTATPIIGCATVNSVKVRAKPSLDGIVVAGLTLGECITVQSFSPDRQWVYYDEGWVSVSLLNFTHLTLDQSLTAAAGATITPTPTPIPTIKQ